MMPSTHGLTFDPEERAEVLESLIESLGVPFLVVDKDLRLLFFSSQAGDLFGLSLSSIGLPLEQIIPGGREGAPIRSVKRAIGGSVEPPVEFERLDGYRLRQQVQPLEGQDGVWVGGLITFRRVQPQPGSSYGPEDLTRMYSELFGHLPDPILRVGESERLLYLNTAAASLFELTPDELLGEEIDRVSRAGFLPAFWADAVRQALSDGSPSARREQLRWKEEERELYWRFLPEYNEFGVPAAVLCVSVDLTPYVESRKEKNNDGRK